MTSTERCRSAKSRFSVIATTSELLTTGTAKRTLFAAPQSQPWSARHDGIAHSACQEGRRRLRRRREPQSLSCRVPSTVSGAGKGSGRPW
jgi:hypothetical protein